MSQTRRGLNLIEVLVAFTALAILVGLLLPATRRVREPAARATCQNNLKMMMVGVHNYASANNDKFPTGCIGPGASPEERLSWLVALLPYIEQEAMAKQFDIEKGYGGNRLAWQQQYVKVFLCPSGVVNPTDSVTLYVAVSGVGSDAAARPAGAEGNGFMGYDRITRMSIIIDGDGSANTIACWRHARGSGRGLAEATRRCAASIPRHPIR